MPAKSSDRPGKLRYKFWRVVGLCLLALLTAYLARGFYYLLFDPAGAGDFHTRWKTMQYLYRGHYPYPGIYDSSVHFDPAIGKADYGGYFPWSFFSFIALIPPLSLTASKVYFAIVNLISLFVLGVFSYRSFAKYGKRERLFAVVSVLAISSHCTTLGVGQLGIVINAALVLMFECLNNRRLIWAGLWCGFALIKPNVSALYFLVLLTPARYRAAITTVGYVASTSFMVAVLTQRDTLSLIAQPLDKLYNYIDHASPVIAALVQIGFSAQLVIPFVMLIGGGACLLLLQKMGSMPLAYQFAIASTVGRVCTYHRAYDNVMLVFLYLSFLHFVLAQPQRPHRVMFYLLALSLWLPTAWFEMQSMATMQSCIWIGAMAMLIKGYSSQPHSLAAPLAAPSKGITSPSQAR